MPWLLPPGGSDNVILFLRIHILTGIEFFRKEWKVVDFFSFFSCVGNCPPPSGENAVVVVDFFFFFFFFLVWAQRPPQRRKCRGVFFQEKKVQFYLKVLKIKS